MLPRGHQLNIVEKAIKAAFDLKTLLVLTTLLTHLTFPRKRTNSAPHVSTTVCPSLQFEKRHQFYTNFNDDSAGDLLSLGVQIKHLLIILQLVSSLIYLNLSVFIHVQIWDFLPLLVFCCESNLCHRDWGKL